jgi:nuclear pore complex protein Nup155
MLRHVGHDSFETSAHHRTPQRNREQEAQLEEKHSLDALKAFVAHTCEVLGMWRVLCEHQFHVVADTLTKVRELSRNMFIFIFIFITIHGSLYMILDKSILLSTILNQYNKVQ